MWQAHKYHHAATEFTILTGNRIHALEEAFRQLLVLVPLALLGTPVRTYLAVTIVMRLVDMFQHSMLPWTFGWAGRWLIYSPVGHRIHHSKLREHWDRNYGDILVIWDRMLGTWYAGSRINETVDVTDNPYNRRGVMVEYLCCVAWYFQALAKSVRTRQWRPAHLVKEGAVLEPG